MAESMIERITGIGIFCSDPRAGLWGAIEKKLLLPGQIIVPIGVLGGPVPLANKEWLPVEFNFLVEQINFALATFPFVQEFIVVGHDCGYYKKVRRGWTFNAKKFDTRTAAAFLTERYTGMRARAYFAEGAPGNVVFEKIFETVPVGV